MNSAPADLVELGRVAAAYGVKGWVKVQPHSAQAEVLRSVGQWWLARPTPTLAPASSPDSKTAPTSYRVVQARPQGATVVAQLEGPDGILDDRDQAEALRGCLVMASRSAFPMPEEGEYYWVDLIGCLVTTTAGTESPASGQEVPARTVLGRVAEVLDNGAHAILRVARLQSADASVPSGELRPMLDAKGRPVELLVPFVAAHIQAVDLAARRIDSDWPAEY